MNNKQKKLSFDIVQPSIFDRSRYAAHQISPKIITAKNSLGNHGP